MKKIKALTAALLAVVLLITSFAFTSCDKDAFPDISSGDKLDINEETIKIEHSLTPAKEKDGYVNYIKSNIKVKGYEELSYFNSAISLTWTFDVLLDDSDGYVEDSYTVTLDLDAEGNAKFKEKLPIENCRSVRNINCELAFDGYAIKK